MYHLLSCGVDDYKILHASHKIKDTEIECLRREYKSIFEDGSGAMKVHKGKVQKHFGMKLISQPNMM